MSASAESRIGRLSIRAPGHARDAAANAVRQAVSNADWSCLAGEKTLFLRRLRVSAPLQGLGPQLVDAAQALASRAVDGRRADADLAEAVSFASRADLLACLLRDLLTRRSRWYWSEWQALFDLPPGRAIVRLMADEILHWPAVVHQLDGMGEAQALWRHLPDGEAQELLLAIERATAWPLGRLSASAGDLTFATPLNQIQDTPLWLRAAMAIQSRRTGNEPVLLRLALVTWFWQKAPQHLARQEAAHQLQRLLDTLMSAARSAGSPSPEQPRENAQVNPPSVQATEPSTLTSGTEPLNPPAGVAHGGQDSASPDTKNAQPSTTGQHAAPLAASAVSDADRDGSLAAPLPSSRAPRRVRDPDQPPLSAIALMPEQPISEARFLTRQGGWFLLLNALAAPGIRQRLQSANATGDLSSGWLWLYRLGRALGASDEAAMLGFFARSAGFTDPAFLSALAPLPIDAELTKLTLERYGESVCNARLFAVPALVVATPSHLDIHYRMADIRLDVRQVGLDINPGWLPWLGRVVSFHYGNAPALQALPS